MIVVKFVLFQRSFKGSEQGDTTGKQLTTAKKRMYPARVTNPNKTAAHPKPVDCSILEAVHLAVDSLKTGMTQMTIDFQEQLQSLSEQCTTTEEKDATVSAREASLKHLEVLRSAILSSQTHHSRRLLTNHPRTPQDVHVT